MEEESGIRRWAGGILYGNRVTLVLRALMGALLLFSGYFKIMDPEAFGAVIVRYGVSGALAAWAAMILPPLELLLGLCLVSGFKVRPAAFIATAMMLLFIVIMSVNLARGGNFECGCFELKRLGLDIGETLSGWLVARDLFFLMAFFVIFMADRHLLSLEGLIVRLRLKNLEETRYQ